MAASLEIAAKIACLLPRVHMNVTKRAESYFMSQQRNDNYNAAIFVDDGGIDAWEFESNYVRFDSRDPADSERAWNEAKKLWAVRSAREWSQEPSFSLRPPSLQVERLSA